MATAQSSNGCAADQQRTASQRPLEPQAEAEAEATAETASGEMDAMIPALPTQLRHEFVQCEPLLKPLMLYYLLAVAQKLPIPALCFVSSAENADRYTRNVLQLL